MAITSPIRMVAPQGLDYSQWSDEDLEEFKDQFPGAQAEISRRRAAPKTPRAASRDAAQPSDFADGIDKDTVAALMQGRGGPNDRSTFMGAARGMDPGIGRGAQTDQRASGNLAFSNPTPGQGWNGNTFNDGGGMPSLSDAKSGYDMYQNFTGGPTSTDSLMNMLGFGGSAVPGGATGLGEGANLTSVYGLPEAGSAALGGSAIAGGSTGLGAGATMTSMYGLPAAGSTSLAGTSGAGAAAGGAMAGLGGLAGLGLFAMLAYNWAENNAKKEAPGEAAEFEQWKKDNADLPMVKYTTDAERDKYYNDIYGKN